jgi:F-type H+-transporting ATPase subunit c
LSEFSQKLTDFCDKDSLQLLNRRSFCSLEAERTLSAAEGGPEVPETYDIQQLSVICAAIAVSFGALGPALAEGKAVAAAMDAIARQPEAAGVLSRTLFVGLAMIETMAIYCLVIALLLLFANPFITK